MPEELFKTQKNKYCPQKNRFSEMDFALPVEESSHLLFVDQTLELAYEHDSDNKRKNRLEFHKC